ncbi:MAG TPA: hypothetical protein VF103_09305 [Polyangiaceae bacterium]
MRSTRVRLPAIGTPSERLLADYAGHLLAALRRTDVAPAVAIEIERAAKGLRNVQHARELSERLAVRAEALAESAEIDIEEAIRALFLALSVKRALREAAFPGGLGAALAPRGDAQVAEVKRLLDATHRAKVPRSVASALVRMGAANALLSSRLSASASAHESLVAMIAAEGRQARSFRQRYRWAYGALTGLFPGDAGKVASFFKEPPRETAGSSGLPSVPAPTQRGNGGRAKAPARKKRT